MSEAANLTVLSVPVFAGTSADALSKVESLADGGPSLIAYANAHTLNVAHDDPKFRDVLRRADIVLNDGVGVKLAARMRGVRLPENLNGSDFNPKILQLATQRGWSVYLLGAAKGVAADAENLFVIEHPGLRIAGTHHGHFRPADDGRIAELVRASGADVVFVAMGNPRQETWLAEHLAATGCRLGVGVGAFFDFTVGAQRRAPAWMNKLGIEWIFRLAREPGRMWRRYVLGNPIFLWRAWRASRRDARAPG